MAGISPSNLSKSRVIHCPSCLTTKGTKSKLRYSHQILQAVMLHPDMRPVIPLAPEPIVKADGNDKNDCERCAGKRLMEKYAPHIPS
jgi:DNA-directed RNA polymerase subunit RPC12/RpoP